jgi:hypothetical protein
MYDWTLHATNWLINCQKKPDIKGKEIRYKIEQSRHKMEEIRHKKIKPQKLKENK